ncbi:DUF1573 domain-containing protein [Pedobacter sp. UC225_61]|uniref:DUF1573 domain-containing protein n=1 Tax=Pedobacter sp. UC225_61 TaxID=3374623 RepID=UPI0037B29389
MKSKISFILIIFALAACKQKKPQIFVDYKDVNKSDTIRHFTIYNKGNAPLIIENFTTSCECTLLKLEKNQIINPNEKIIADIKIDKSKVGTGNQIFLTIKTNAVPRLTSFHFNL